MNIDLNKKRQLNEELSIRNITFAKVHKGKQEKTGFSSSRTDFHSLSRVMKASFGVHVIQEFKQNIVIFSQLRERESSEHSHFIYLKNSILIYFLFFFFFFLNNWFTYLPKLDLYYQHFIRYINKYIHKYIHL